jgi:hypothetical protein
MKANTARKLAQVLGAVGMIVGVAGCSSGDFTVSAWGWLIGSGLYAWGRLSAWFAEK